MQPFESKDAEQRVDADVDDDDDYENSEEGEENRTGIEKKEAKLLFFDFETNQETGTHTPNLVVVQDENGVERNSKEFRHVMISVIGYFLKKLTKTPYALPTTYKDLMGISSSLI